MLMMTQNNHIIQNKPNQIISLPDLGFEEDNLDITEQQWYVSRCKKAA